MQVTASLVKILRERTGAGMMDCKKALQQANGDIEVAIEEMRKSGVAQAAKKAGRIAADGCVVLQQQEDRAVILEVNSETDFVAKEDSFKAFSNQIAQLILDAKPKKLNDLNLLKIEGHTVEEVRQQLVLKLGENIHIRRFNLVQSGGVLSSYLHSNSRIGVIVDTQGATPELAKDLAMHIAACNPTYLSSQDVPAEVVSKEDAVFLAQAKESGKPDHLIEKIVSGKRKRWLGEITLLGQPFVKDDKMKVEKILKTAQASVRGFIRYEVGEGIEKRTDNFADEVMAQIEKRT